MALRADDSAGATHVMFVAMGAATSAARTAMAPTASDQASPRSARWVLCGAVTVSITVVALDPDLPRRGLVVPLLLVVVAVGWYLPLAGLKVPTVVRAAFTLGVIGAINLGARGFGFNDDQRDHVQFTLLFVLILVGEVVATAPTAVAVISVTVSAAITASPLLWANGAGYIWSIALALTVMSGLFVRRLGQALDELETAQASLAAEVAGDERRRIAREIHDVVAHSMSVTMLHLSAARLAVGRGDPGAANEALEEAERAGRQSLADIRLTVGLLRSDAEEHGGRTDPPMPVAADLETLIASYRDAGLTVALNVTGALARVDPNVGLALYRIAQESLANVVRHAPGAEAAIDVDFADPVRIRVSSRGAAAIADSRRRRRSRRHA